MSFLGCSRPMLPLSKFLGPSLQQTPPTAKSQAIILTSDTLIEYKADEDAIAKIIVLKAPVIKISSCLSAAYKLVIETDLLILDMDNAYITKPKYWDLKIAGIRLRNLKDASQWIITLKQIQDGVECIYSSNFDSKNDHECTVDFDKNVDIASKIKDIGKDIKDKIKIFFPNFKHKV